MRLFASRAVLAACCCVAVAAASVPIRPPVRLRSAISSAFSSAPKPSRGGATPLSDAVDKEGVAETSATASMQMGLLLGSLRALRTLAERFPKNANIIDASGTLAVIFLGDPIIGAVEKLLGDVKVNGVRLAARRFDLDFDNFYVKIKKPSWTPPDWAFPAAWIPARALQTAAVSRVWRAAGRRPFSPPMLCFLTYQVLADQWNNVFFRRRSIGTGFSTIAALDASFVATGLQFYKTNSSAGWLLAPTAAILTFATALNYRIWRMNGSPPLYPTKDTFRQEP